MSDLWSVVVAEDGQELYLHHVDVGHIATFELLVSEGGRMVADDIVTILNGDPL